jgi:outer membrane lipoprotein-sorting protein
MRRKLFIILFSLLISICHAQNPQTPTEYFEEVSLKFSTINDYEANIKIFRNDSLSMEGTIFYKKPNKILIEFTNPANEVFVTNGRELFWYIPSLSYVLKQKFRGESMGVASEEGLTYLAKNYNIGYAESPEPVALSEENQEKVIKLVFASSTASFPELEIAFTLTGLIRQIKGYSFGNSFTIYYYNIETNTGMPDIFFDWEPPPDATIFENFLYKVTE